MRYDSEKNANYLNTWDVIKQAWKKKTTKVVKESVSSLAPLPAPSDIDINYVAIVLDGEVREVIRAESKLAALLLSGPEFVPVEGSPNRPTIGWKYDKGSFTEPEHTHEHGHNHGH